MTPRADAQVHEVQYYEHSSFLVGRVADFIGSGLEAGEAAVVIATPKHADLIDAELLRRGIGLAAARTAGALVELDAVETLGAFMVAGRPDPDRFGSVIGNTIERARSNARTPVVRVFGEMVGVLCGQGRIVAAIDIEELWNQLLGAHPCALLHGYPIAPLHGRDMGSLSALHTNAAGAEGSVRIG